MWAGHNWATNGGRPNRRKQGTSMVMGLGSWSGSQGGSGLFRVWCKLAVSADTDSWQMLSCANGLDGSIHVVQL